MKKNKFLLICIMVFVILSFIFIYIFVNIFPKFRGNREKADLNEYFNIKTNELALIYNDELQVAKAMKYNDAIYVPLSFVSTLINDKFYYTDEDSLIYTLPTSILYADYETLSSSGKNYLVKNEDEVYILLDIVDAYTNMSYKYYDDKDIKRLFINDDFNEYLEASVRRNTVIRTKADKKSEIVTNIKKGSVLKLITDDITDEYIKDKDLKFVKVRTDDGYIGYINKKNLKNFVKNKLKTNFKEEKYTSISFKKPIILAWHQVTTKEANKGIDNILAKQDVLNVISPTWFSLSDNLGNYKSLASKEYVDKAHAKGIQVWALIDNFSKDVSTFKLTSSTKARKNLIANIIKDVKEFGIDGINIDFESLSKDASKHYIQFIRELSIETRKNNIVLSVDVPNYESYNYHYKRDDLAQVSDYIINMAYDEHYAGSQMGSVASIAFVKSGIDKTLEEVSSNKLINAIPVYTRVWTKESSKALGIKSAKAWVEENNIKLEWLDDIGQYYGKTNIDGEDKHIWLEENTSLKLKLDYAKEKKLAGAAIWKIGLEDEEFWTLISEYK